MTTNQSYIDFSRQQISAGKAASPVTAAKLQAFLSKLDVGGRIVSLRLDQGKLKAGASSGTVLFDLEIQTPAEATKIRQLVFRYDLGGVFFKQYQLEPQFWVMKAVRNHGIPAPVVLWLDSEGEVAGHPGLFMEKVLGAAPSMSPFAEGPLVEASVADRHAMVLGTIDVLAEVHKLDVATLGLRQYEKRGTGNDFIDREINWLMRELHLALDHQLEGPSKALYREQLTKLTSTCEWLTGHAPRHRRPELAHGDSMVTNFMFRGNQVSALLDWENTHYGIGEVDIAYQFAGRDYFGLMAPPPEGLPTLEEMAAHYREARGKLEDWHYARVMAAWRAGLISVLGKSRLPADMDDFKRRSWSVTQRQLNELLAPTA